MSQADVNAEIPIASDSDETAAQDSTAPALEEKNTEPEFADLWARIRAGLTWQDIDNERVARERKWYLQQHNFLGQAAERASLYMHYIVGEIEKRELPVELALLPLVESNLNPFASSTSYAAGMWQIMPATGKHLGLTQDWWFDGRRDLRESTRAALDYLEELYVATDEDWLLTLAAYNAGKSRVKRARRNALKHGQPTDYWSLKLPRETRRYVPKLIALTQIIAAPDAFGVTIPPVANTPAFEVVATGGQLEFARAAQLAGLDTGALRALNSGHLRWATAPAEHAELLLPPGHAENFTTALAQLPTDERVEWNHYRIKRGDSLIRIARKFNVEVALLREVNDISGSNIRAGATMLIPRGDAWASSLALAQNRVAKPHGYRVRRGDSLYRIADRFKVSIRDIVSWNALDPRKYLQPGQKLTLYVNGG